MTTPSPLARDGPGADQTGEIYQQLSLENMREVEFEGVPREKSADLRMGSGTRMTKARMAPSPLWLTPGGCSHLNHSVGDHLNDC